MLLAQPQCDVTVATGSTARAGDTHLQMRPRWYPIPVTLEVHCTAVKVVDRGTPRASGKNEREENVHCGAHRRCRRTTKLTHEGRRPNSRIAPEPSAALIVCSAWFGVHPTVRH